MKLCKEIYTLEITNQNSNSTINPILVHDDSELILIDTGFPGQIELIREKMKEYSFSPEQITKVIFTHQDIDHIGTITDLKEINPNIQVYCHTEEAPYIDGKKVPIKLAQKLKTYENLSPDEKIGIDMLKAGFEARQTKIDILLDHGDILPFAGDIQIIHTPGHTPGHICLYFEKYKILATGDALNLNMDENKLLGPNPVFTQDMDLAVNSLKQLLDLDIETLACYHGGIYQENIKASLETIINTHK